ncbi:sn-glycerol-3-phosphate ABC transporter ATP-binding protein UgpC [Acuticoccus sp. M5D2P5]|uniref:ABC transporter ATP-binding protein n=1 Tax=Acuticoccus kalidii TaxID=2910977 RepID=UPI001F16A624|nr:sn-glycerol-3-phosphate ABC transporter ATP-binding protein UgpC [Acuticoccus kalidii]MCF3932097.1 sn-glycerol-3-phosphate ABC transporter ATP-binding protein UgpC [Acuticoccus kalidii]
MAFLDINSVTKTFGPVQVLEDVNLSIERGEFVVFVGPSGCGKSTLLRMISGLEEVTAGTIAIEGEVLNDVEPAQRGAAMVFQSYALYPHMTTAQNMSFGLRMARKAKSFIRARIDEAAGILRLEALLDRRPGQLSGGQKQRVAIGRAIVREPRVFLFDEPLSNLDAELRVRMRAELMDLHRRLGTTMIYVTHDQVEAMTLADKMVVMHAGKVQQAGRPLTLYDDPDNRFVAGFVGSPTMNFIPAKVAGADASTVRLSAIGGTAEGALAFAGFDSAVATVEIGVRPEHMRVLADGESTDAPVVLDADVVLVEELGDVTYVHLHLPDGTRLIARAERGLDSHEGRMRVVPDMKRALLFGPDGARLRPAAWTAAA